MDSPDSFALKPEEDWLFGVSYYESVLRFGRPGGTLLSVSLVGSLLTAVAVLWFLVPEMGRDGSPFPGWMASSVWVGVLVGVIWSVVNLVRMGVQATQEGVEVRALLRRQHYPWNEIVDVVVEESEPPGPRFSIGIGSHGGGVPIDTASARAFLVLSSGTQVELRGFESASRDCGLALGGATPTEVKVAALRRSRSAVS